jgi:DNA-binding transcriptional ArsR family regulator
MKKTTTRVHTPIGNIITHRSPGGSESHERTGVLGIFDIVQGIKGALQQMKVEQEKRADSEERAQKQEKKKEESLFYNNQNTIKSPRTRKFLGDRVRMKSPGGLPAPAAYFNVHNGGNGLSEVHGRILKVLRKAIDKNPISSLNVRELNRNASYDKTVSPYTPLNVGGKFREGGDMARELREATKKRQRTLSMPMSREKELPDYALQALKDAKALRKIRGLMRGKRFNSTRKMRLHPTADNDYRYSKIGPHLGLEPISSRNMKVVGKYKRPSAGAIYRRHGRVVVGMVFSIPQPPDGKRLENKQLCLRKAKNKNSAYFAPIGTCMM